MRNRNHHNACAILRNIARSVRRFDRATERAQYTDPGEALELLRDVADYAIRARRLIEGRAR